MKVWFFIFLSFPVMAQDYFNIELRSHWTDTSVVLGSGEVRFSDLWGFKVNGEKYAVIGSNEGSHFLKVNEYSVNEVDFKQGAFSGPLVQHRDYKRYKNFIYAVCDEGPSSLQIFDISKLPDSVSIVYDSDHLFITCHNIFIDTSSARLYACGPNGVGLKIFDISEPTNPTLLLNFTNINYVHDCFVLNDTAFLNSGVDGLRIYDFSNLAFPMELGVLSTYQEKGYNHSGWMNDSRTVYCFIDETEGKKIKFCKLDRGLDNIQVNALFGTKKALDYVAHNIQIVEGFAFVSYYNEGLRIFDLEQSPIKEVAYFDTYLIESSFKLHGAWGVFVFVEDEIVILSDRQSGFFSFYFPFSKLRKQSEKSKVYGNPVINENSQIIINMEGKDDLFFDIYSVSGSIIYRQQLAKNWVNIPLSLKPGLYVYKVYSLDSNVKSTGKFAVLM
ncbi:MAG: choice-of-anchor B family protein [Crocinitomicaceae bacterium]